MWKTASADWKQIISTSCKFTGPMPPRRLPKTMEAVAELIEEGKVRAAGVCNYSADQVEEALKTVNIVSNQVPYSMVKPQDRTGCNSPGSSKRNFHFTVQSFATRTADRKNTSQLWLSTMVITGRRTVSINRKILIGSMLSCNRSSPLPMGMERPFLNWWSTGLRAACNHLCPGGCPKRRTGKEQCAVARFYTHRRRVQFHQRGSRIIGAGGMIVRFFPRFTNAIINHQLAINN